MEEKDLTLLPRPISCKKHLVGCFYVALQSLSFNLTIYYLKNIITSPAGKELQRFRKDNNKFKNQVSGIIKLSAG